MTAIQRGVSAPQPCPVCAVGTGAPYRDVDGVAFFRCDRCGSLFADSAFIARVENGDVTNYRSAYWESEMTAARERGYGASLMRLAETFRMCRIPIESVIDIGAGAGTLLDAIAALLPEISDRFHGIELFPPEPAQRTRHPNYRIGTLGDLDRRFQAGICMEVIEHLPPNTLRTLVAQLASCSVPGSLYLFNSAQPAFVHTKNPGYLDPFGRGHIVSYSVAGLAPLFAAHGFRLANLPGRHWAFYAEYAPGEPPLTEAMLQTRLWSPLPANMALLKQARFGPLMIGVGLDSARCYFEHAAAASRTRAGVLVDGWVARLKPALRAANASPGVRALFRIGKTLKRAIDRAPVAVWFAVAIFAFGRLAVRAGPDGNWDLLNYHLYDAYAALHGRLGFDIAPAQLQTYLNPVLDLAGYGLRAALNSTPKLLAVLLALPNAIMFTITLLLGRALLPRATAGQRNLPRNSLATVAAFFGASGAASVSTLATSASEAIPGCFALAGVLALVATPDEGPGWCSAPRRLIVAGIGCGLAAGLKLTFMPFCAGLVLALVLAGGGGIRARTVRAAWCIAGMAAAFLLVAGPWCWLMARNFGNPLFPYFNNIFHSPWLSPLPFTDERFKPDGVIQTLAYPIFWAFHRSTAVSELPIQDPRFAVAWVATVVGLARAFITPDRTASGRRAAFLLTFGAAAFALWQEAFSIFRYLATLQALTGIILLAAMRPWAWRPRASLAGLVSVSLACVLLTFTPNWGHADRHGPAISVHLPPLAPDSLVIILDDSPSSFLATASPPSARWVGANNNLLHPGLSGRLEALVESTIAQHAGPFWGVEGSGGSPIADQTLAYYGLRRDTCVPVDSNLGRGHLRMCRLSRAARGDGSISQQGRHL